jgi:AraC-like DNA-binding protein
VAQQEPRFYFAVIDLPPCVPSRIVPMSRWRSPKRRQFALPDALGVATRWAVERLRERSIVLAPLLRSAGLSVSQIDEQGTQIAVASQITFLELAANELKDPFLGFRLARDGDLRQIGLLHYAIGASETLGDALHHAQRYSSIVNSGVVLRCSEVGNLTVVLRYVDVARHSDRQQMEFLVTALIRGCRVLTGCHLTPTAVRLVHRLSGKVKPSEFEKFLGCRIEFGAETDEIVFDKKVGRLHLVGADPYLSDVLLHYCEQALAYRRSNANSLRIMIENAITPLLPHGKAKFVVVARKLGMSNRTLARRLAAEGFSFTEIRKRLRFDLTKFYLSDVSLSISQVAWLVGFQSISAFSQSCKRWAGISPKGLRAKLLASA